LNPIQLPGQGAENGSSCHLAAERHHGSSLELSVTVLKLCSRCAHRGGYSPANTVPRKAPTMAATPGSALGRYADQICDSVVCADGRCVLVVADVSGAEPVRGGGSVDGDNVWTVGWGGPRRRPQRLHHLSITQLPGATVTFRRGPPHNADPSTFPIAVQHPEGNKTVHFRCESRVLAYQLKYCYPDW
jgi:hypothetical protein